MTTMAQSIGQGNIAILKVPGADISSTLKAGILSQAFITAVQNTEDAAIIIDKEGLRIEAKANDFRKLANTGGIGATPISVAYNEANKIIEAYENRNLAFRLFKTWWSYTGPVCIATVDVPGSSNTTLTINKYGL